MKLTENKKIETNKYDLTINVDAQEFETAINTAFKKNNKNITVPGFRKGKATRKMVEKIYGESCFYEDAMNEIYPKALDDATKEANLELVARPVIEVKSVDKNGFEFVATCIVKPDVEIQNYKGIEVVKTVKTVAAKDVNAKIEAMRERNSRLVDVTDRDVKKSDVITFDFDGYVDNTPFDGGKAEKFSLEIGSGQFIPGFEEQLIGKKIGDEFDVSVNFPEEYHVENLKGKPAIFKCKIHEIKAKELPELDDEFAKDVSEFDTLQELKSDTKSKLQEEAKKEADTNLENSIIDKVIENMVAEIPNEMFESRIDEMIHDFEHRLQSQGMDINTYLQYSGLDLTSFRQTFQEQAQKQVKIRLALEKIVKLENITISEEELETEFQKIAESYKMEVEKVKSFIPVEDFTKDIAVNRAIDLVKSSAKITEETSK